MTQREWPASFRDRLTTPLPSNKDIFRILREGGFHGRNRPKSEADKVPRAAGILPDLKEGQSSVTWVGHATTLVRFGGLNILTDPVWSTHLPGRSRRLVAPGVAWENLPRIDAVVISHNHYDHLDASTIKRLPKEVTFFVPAGVARWFRKRGYDNVVELDWWESKTLRNVKFDFVPAHHWSRRTLTDSCKTLWGGWVMTAPSGDRVYFAGDTGYGHWFKEIGARYPGMSTAIIPIGAYAPSWFMRPVHLDPEEALRALDDLGGKRLVGMHWGTFVLTQEPVMEPLARIRNAWSMTDRPREDLWDLSIGESRVW